MSVTVERGAAAPSGQIDDLFAAQARHPTVISFGVGAPDPALLPAFWFYAPDSTVYITSLSKTLAPALRIGITVLPDQLVEPVLALKQGIDMQTSVLNQAIAAEFLDSATASAHLDHIIAVYAAEMDAVTTALERHFPDGFSWTDPDGGMFVWIEGPADFDAVALAQPAREAGVVFIPGTMFYAQDDAPRNAMRLSIAGVPQDDIDRGIALLADLCGSR
ncbi:aminotransferase class I/II-fold pyridoxal phosphate-dependent enzyme [Nocardia sp. bgisy118]|uniref:aminotransferase class I/II-fold pyridoxal phosphate-dependent enzyme n=1 Tax=Nocardia sp. bgisy118 TaxID=3413786 RepID=UPI003F49B446